MSTGIFSVPLYVDGKLLSLDADELAFFRSQTGIQDEEELKHHIVDVTIQAYKIFGYSCISGFVHTKLKISRQPAYQRVLRIAQERKGALLLDIGCCFGNDIRKAVTDGWPVENAMGSDIKQGFWECGHALFKSTSETFPAKFLEGDAFDLNFIPPREPFYEPPKTSCPPLDSLTSFATLQGHISAIHASSLFHLFDEAKQVDLARRLASLLSPLPGSTIFGVHSGRTEKGYATETTFGDFAMFCHSPETWAELWNVEVFKRGTVRVDAKLVEVYRPDLLAYGHAKSTYKMMTWSVTRL